MTPSITPDLNLLTLGGHSYRVLLPPGAAALPTNLAHIHALTTALRAQAASLLQASVNLEESAGELTRRLAASEPPDLAGFLLSLGGELALLEEMERTLQERREQIARAASDCAVPILVPVSTT